MTDDLAALVARLRQYRGQQHEVMECYNGLRDEAAAAIESLAAENARLTVERADSNDYVAWLTFRKKDGTHSGGRIRICDSDSPGAFKVYRAAPVSAVLESIDIANELAAKEQTWNAAMERAAEIADYYAEAMKSEAARRAADQIRACKLPLPSPEDIA